MLSPESAIMSNELQSGFYLYNSTDLFEVNDYVTTFIKTNLMDQGKRREMQRVAM